MVRWGLCRAGPGPGSCFLDRVGGRLPKRGALRRTYRKKRLPSPPLMAGISQPAKSYHYTTQRSSHHCNHSACCIFRRNAFTLKRKFKSHQTLKLLEMNRLMYDGLRWVKCCALVSPAGVSLALCHVRTLRQRRQCSVDENTCTSVQARQVHLSAWLGATRVCLWASLSIAPWLTDTSQQNLLLILNPWLSKSSEETPLIKHK